MQHKTERASTALAGQEPSPSERPSGENILDKLIYEVEYDIDGGAGEAERTDASRSSCVLLRVEQILSHALTFGIGPHTPARTRSIGFSGTAGEQERARSKPKDAACSEPGMR